MRTITGWKPKKLTELADYINGYAFKPDDWGKEGLPIIRIEQLKDPEAPTDYFDGKLPPSKIIKDGDLIFSWSASLYLRIWRHGYAALNQHLFNVIERQDVDRAFLKAFIDFYLPSLTAASHGSTMQHITRKELARFSAPFPESKLEQTKIAEILLTVDQAIERTEALIVKQQRIKTGLMQDLLTRGIDEHGNLRSEQTHQLKDSPLGRIPVEWGFGKISHYISFIKSGLSRRLLEEDIGVPVITSTNIQRSSLEISQLSFWYLKDPQGAKTESFFLDDGDVLLNFINSIEQIGKVCLFNDLGRPTIYTTNLFRIKASQISSQAFLCHLLDSQVVQNEIKFITKPAVNQASFTTIDFLGIDVPLLSSSEQLRIVEFLSGLQSNHEGATLSLAKLKRVKSGLMQDLLTGKKRVTALLEPELTR